MAAWDTSQSGPAKKGYRLPTLGRCCLRRWIASLLEYREGITALLRAARQAVGRSP